MCESEIRGAPCMDTALLDLSPALIEHDSKGQGKSQTKGMLALLRQGERCTDTLQGLIRIATQP